MRTHNNACIKYRELKISDNLTPSDYRQIEMD